MLHRVPLAQAAANQQAEARENHLKAAAIDAYKKVQAHIIARKEWQAHRANEIRVLQGLERQLEAAYQRGDLNHVYSLTTEINRFQVSKSATDYVNETLSKKSSIVDEAIEKAKKQAESRVHRSYSEPEIVFIEIDLDDLIRRSA